MAADPQQARAFTWYDVPAGTRPARCRGQSCQATIYFVRNPATSRIVPVDCDVDGGKRPSDTKDSDQTDAFSGTASVFAGRGVSHFQTCPDAEAFHR